MTTNSPTKNNMPALEEKETLPQPVAPAEHVLTEAEKAEQAEQLAEEQRAKKVARALRIRAARDLAGLVRTMPDGSRMFVRFGLSDINEHWILLISFSLLGFSGLLQRYSEVTEVAWVINNILGGIDVLRSLHHLMAVVLGLQVVYHILHTLFLWFVKRESGGMLPSVKDIPNFFSLLAYKLGLRKVRPPFGRYTVEQKIEYWVLGLSILLLGVTGLMQWFPALATQYLPGNIILIARAVHGFQAVFTVMIVVMWHVYSNVLKVQNLSIFNGLMSDQQMKDMHPLEHERIVKSYELIKSLKVSQSTAAKVPVENQAPQETVS